MRVSQLRALSLILTALFAYSAASADPSTDFDDDGTSDLTAVSIGEDNSLQWTARSSSTGLATDLSEFGASGDHLAPAHWSNSAATTLVVVRQNDSAALEWVLNGGSTLTFGSSTDTFLAGGDFDGSGLADAATVTARDGSLYWKVSFDPFAPSPSTLAESEEIQFGTTEDKPFFFSLDGAQDLAAVLSKTENSIKLKNLITSEEQVIPIRSAYAKMDAPLPVKGPLGTDLFLFSTVKGLRTIFNVVNSAGRKIALRKIRGRGTVVVGNFAPNTDGEEVAVQEDSTFRFFSPSTSLRTPNIDFAAAIPVDEININSFSDGSNGDTVGIGGCAQYDPNDGSKIGFVWKPNSDTTYYAVAVLSGALYGKVSKVETFTADGTLIKELTFTGCGNPDPTGIRCNHKDFSLTGRNYQQRYGSIILKVSLKAGGCGTYYIENPATRTD